MTTYISRVVAAKLLHHRCHPENLLILACMGCRIGNYKHQQDSILCPATQLAPKMNSQRYGYALFIS